MLQQAGRLRAQAGWGVGGGGAIGGGGVGDGGGGGGGVGQRDPVPDDRTSGSRWAISVAMPSGLGRARSADWSKPVYTGRTIVGAVLSTTITKTGYCGLGSIPTRPAPGRGLRLLPTPPAQSHPAHPAHSVAQAPMGDWRSRECRAAGGPGVAFRRVRSAFCVLCVEAVRLAFRLHRNLTRTSRDRITHCTFDGGERALNALSTASAVATAGPISVSVCCRESSVPQ